MGARDGKGLILGRNLHYLMHRKGSVRVHQPESTCVLFSKDWPQIGALRIKAPVLSHH